MPKDLMKNKTYFDSAVVITQIKGKIVEKQCYCHQCQNPFLPKGALSPGDLQIFLGLDTIFLCFRVCVLINIKASFIKKFLGGKIEYIK